MTGVAVLAGGVGAARLLRGLVDVVPPEDVTAIVNTGDDMVLHGLAISPDIDTVTYTLADAIDPERGWGLRDESWHAMDALSRYGGVTWFRLGDRDLAIHLYRTQRLADGAGLAAVTAEIARAWGLGLRIVPATEQPLRTMITLATDEVGSAVMAVGVVPGEEISFQDYFVRLQHAVPVAGVRFAGAEEARPAPGVLAAIAGADTVVVHRPGDGRTRRPGRRHRAPRQRRRGLAPGRWPGAQGPRRPAAARAGTRRFGGWNRPPVRALRGHAGDRRGRRGAGGRRPSGRFALRRDRHDHAGPGCRGGAVRRRPPPVIPQRRR
jgi:hypothetical protein